VAQQAVDRIVIVKSISLVSSPWASTMMQAMILPVTPLLVPTWQTWVPDATIEAARPFDVRRWRGGACHLHRSRDRRLGGGLVSRSRV